MNHVPAADFLLAGFVRRHGHEYIPSLLRDDMHRGPINHCFDNCTVAALASKGKYQYVEGITEDPRERGRWIHHAWISDGLHAYDLTWQALDSNNVEVPMPSRYIGIPMSAERVAAFMIATQYASVLANRKKNEKLALEAIYSVIPRL